MGLSDGGRDFLAQALINDSSPTFFTNAVAYLGVGNGATAFNKTHTDLQGASKSRRAMDSTYPQRTTNQITAKSTWPDTFGEFVWEEWGFFNASTAGLMFNRVVSAMGTKVGGSTWVLTVTITLTN